MSGFELNEALNAKLEQNSEDIDAMAVQIGRHATAQCSYRCAKAKAELRYREGKYPASMIPDLAKGDDEVAPLMREAICQELMVKVCNERIQLDKREADNLRDQITREWGRPQ